MILPAAGNDIALAVIAFALVLIPAIILHELGHFFAAKLVGINVLEFGLGFPPRVARLFMWGETEFTLNLLPLGGFVRPLGEDLIGPIDGDKVKRDRDELQRRNSEMVRLVSEREMLELRGVEAHRMMSVNEAPPLGRLFFMSAGAMMNFLTALALFFVAALFGLSLPVGGLSQIDFIAEGSLFAGSRAKVGDVIEKINGERFSDFSAFHDILAEYDGERIVFSLLDGESGQAYELKLSPEFGERAGFVQVITVQEESPAAEAGFLAGDYVIAIDGVAIAPSGDTAASLREAVEKAEGRPLRLTVLRALEEGPPARLELTVKPRLEPPAGQGRLGMGIRSGFGLSDRTRFANGGTKYELIPQTVSQAISYSLRTTGETFRAIASIPGQLLDGSLSGRDARAISIIGISKIGGELLQRSLTEGPGLMLHFIALISIFLGISNLLPIPALDGGRILFVLLEILRGKPVNPKTEARVHQIGILLLLVLGVIIMIYDLIHPPSLG